ncbi:hypothetical protein DC498_22195 [Terrimonas sp.]|uniref:hypothetical protein n=1 Tax=Terrimonas sp. TaxID=1914338 RepID=UPI000D50EF81|nr:hypothetical protein [Terrimonas sp.]PVD50033.1 hypothetical protein DC498_22195 [Terrimonas sp.]
MKGKQLYYFADAVDMDPIFKKFEQIESVQYFQAGMFDLNFTPIFTSIFEYKDLGKVSSGDWNHTDSFLIIQKENHINVREVPQKKGGYKFAIDQMNNPKSIVFKVAGILKDGILVGGYVGTISNDEDSLKLFKSLTLLIKKEFKKIGNFYVGKDAQQKLASGWRLVTNEKSPKEYDLSL